MTAIVAHASMHDVVELRSSRPSLFEFSNDATAPMSRRDTHGADRLNASTRDARSITDAGMWAARRGHHVTSERVRGSASARIGEAVEIRRNCRRRERGGETQCPPTVVPDQQFPKRHSIAQNQRARAERGDSFRVTWPRF